MSRRYKSFRYYTIVMNTTNYSDALDAVCWERWSTTGRSVRGLRVSDQGRKWKTLFRGMEDPSFSKCLLLFDKTPEVFWIPHDRSSDLVSDTRPSTVPIQRETESRRWPVSRAATRRPAVELLGVNLRPQAARPSLREPRLRRASERRKRRAPPPALRRLLPRYYTCIAYRVLTNNRDKLTISPT